MFRFLFVFLCAISFAGKMKKMDCEDDCEDFVNCLYNTTQYYQDGPVRTKAMQLTWDCLWEVDHYMIVQAQMKTATDCTIKIYDGEDRSEVEDCYAENVYGPAITAWMCMMMMRLAFFVFGVLSLVAICVSHFRCCNAPSDYSSWGFRCCRCFCPLASVISVDRYQDSTAIAAAFGGCGCIYTNCCWHPKGSEELNTGLAVNDSHNQGTWGV